MCILVLGTPLAWWLARHDSWIRRGAALVVDIPIILPPAVVGLALLESFGRKGILEHPLKLVGLEVPFSSLAVVLAQIVVAAPFYIHSATSGFRSVNDDHRAVAMTLGASPWASFWHVSLPMAGPSILGGLGLAWARAVDEFEHPDLCRQPACVTQTMPLAIYAALDKRDHCRRPILGPDRCCLAHSIAPAEVNHSEYGLGVSHELGLSSTL